MTAKNHTIDLPEIPSLQVPEPSDCASSSSLRPSSMASQPLRYSSYASQDTFLSPPPDSNGVSAEENQLATTSHSLSPNSTLRKSISVDSFVGSKPPPQASRATRGNTMSSNLAYPREARLRLSQSGQAGDPMPSTSRMPTKERERRGAPPPFIPSQSRGTSSGATTDARDHSYFLDESDMERSEDLSRRARKSKTASNQAIPPPGELGLPSRLQTMSSFPNINANHPPAPIIPARSSSLSHKMAKQKSPMSLDTHIPPPPQSPQISIAVIGAAGCGKSTVIRKGLKAYKLSESTTSSFSAGPTATDDDVQIPYTRWNGKISAGHNSPDYLLRILEVDISALDLSQSGAKYWERPSLNGIIVCYDAAREESFQHVADGLREFAHLKLPTIVLACKSDLPLHVDPKRAARVLQQYDVGLIEVATTNPAGKDKIRTAFEWIFKAIFREDP
ncbi:uncharacterized protein LAESUDRAFT_400607 [Laetiporus sulphureus 93-53]|uniref:P-loop containing nucleoside triphosphate hydrolase protein n=1 Tax=Laetiporus sulphureus 93-53 TaxID=1314785 RepID=A0A165CFX3_9APHY|nr:uncharacterized protein LAESUDRAFT_400607 [Laetiporus sulphureus 93-53]KZT02739.1 hypothetical protein LAESUDRAFT_400607 [Laetiporus sulphureus 93-53]